MRGKLRLVGICSLLFLVFGVTEAQQALETFGKNRIQYKQFRWSYLSSENFDVYYYDDRKKVAQESIEYLEAEFDRVTDLIGFYPYQKTKVFLYNSITDLQQSNIGLNHTQYSSGGETDFVKPYVEIAHPGTLESFKEELIYKFADLMLQEMLFGGSLKDMFQNAVLLNLPDWFVDGASLYVAKGWNEEMDDFARQLVVDKKKGNKALKLSGYEAALVGQSIWNFIVEKYGKSSINNILNYTRIIRNEEKSVLITLGIPFNQLMLEWKDFYSAMETRIAQTYVAPTDSTLFSPKHRKTIVFTTVKISPDGKKVAYAENDRGKFTIKVKSLENGRETVILNGGNHVIKQDVDYKIPLLSWSDANTLGVIGVKNGQYVFWLYDLVTKSKLPRELDRFSNIRSFNFSGNGRLAILSADLQGQNDLFLISSRRDRTRRLTNDLYDDLDPSFIPNSNTIVFTSNRTTDSVDTSLKQYSKSSPNYNLLLFNLDTTANVVKRVTNTFSKDFHPKAFDENNFYYLSDQRGIVNLFKYDRQTGIYSQITNFNSSIKDFDLDFYNRSLALVTTKNLSEDIFIINNFNFQRQIFTPASRRKEIQQAKIVTEKRKKEPAKSMSIKDLINSRLKEKQDTSRQEQEILVEKDTTEIKSNVIDVENYQFEDVPKSDTLKPQAIKEKPLNTDDYVFEDEAVKAKQPSETFLTRYMKARESSRVTGPFPYAPKFSYENVVTNFVIDPLRGFSMKIETQMNDMLENYRILGGLQTAFDFKSGDVYLEFQYLPNRVDFSARFDRRVIFWETPQENISQVEEQKYSFQKIEVGASLPISVRTRVTAKPFIGFTQFLDRGLEQPQTMPVFKPTEYQFYGGAKGEVVYDNSITTGMNLIEGTRGKLGMVYYGALGDNQKSFAQVSLDIRHYQKIYREIVFAVRGFAGTFFGNSPKYYMLGGMDNWFGNTINYEGLQNPLTSGVGVYNQNLLFSEFTTSLRGFDYATLYGNSVAVLNSEFRVPLVRALSNGPIASNFFRNLQFTAFYDIGTSWTGAPPFDSKNSVRKRVVPEDTSGSPFIIELNDYLNPWLYSYGFGLRTMMLGYYMKFDLAWPVENYKVRDPRVYVTLGFDF
ncbi:MAG: translocation protein TolB [Cytophagales bacterium]|nr:translocation protein TolB [Cytophagales bacterium]